MHVVLVAQLCVTVTPWTVARQAPLSMGILQVRILEWAAIPIQGSNPGLLHCRRILYHLNHQGSPQIYVERESIFSSVAQ